MESITATVAVVAKPERLPKLVGVTLNTQFAACVTETVCPAGEKLTDPLREAPLRFSGIFTVNEPLPLPV